MDVTARGLPLSLSEPGVVSIRRCHRVPCRYFKRGTFTMSGGLDVLQMKEEDVLKFLAAGTHLGGTNLDFQMEQYIYKRKSDAREGNRRSGTAPTTCRFYKELDAILGCDPTANPRSRMESSEQGEVGEGVEDAESEATGVEGDIPESQEACSQELFSSQEEASQSQQREVAGEEAEERARVTLTNAAGSTDSRRLQNLRKNPRKSKEELIKAVMNHYTRESRKMQEWREKMHEWRQTQSRRKELATKKTSKRLISLLACQTDSFESLVAMQADLYRGNPHPSQSSFLFPSICTKHLSPAACFLLPSAAPNTCTITYQP
ncbi:40S ribosomal protein SA isoform X2 [Gopherus flavomarginatus]|uniref:40S ribosomal protein SA isoform X2 n=1 Tax=Gopherus flavomarginatus TaxID=286002 RepID=UPI0021CBEC85|nr:40S ribosomal protein SA isoform X2 [Gopherus flavomarginatus]